MIQNDIRTHLKEYKPTSIVNYGRSFDTALEAAKKEIQDWFIFIDPIKYSGTINETETATAVIGFLKQDSPHSAYDVDDNFEMSDSIEEIQDEAHTLALSWLSAFLDSYKYSVGNYSLDPLTRVKNVMSGVLFTVDFNYKPSC